MAKAIQLSLTVSPSLQFATLVYSTLVYSQSYPPLKQYTVSLFTAVVYLRMPSLCLQVCTTSGHHTVDCELHNIMHASLCIESLTLWGKRASCVKYLYSMCTNN